MVYAKFQDHGTSGSEEEDSLKVLAIYGHDSHLGHVTKTIFNKFMCDSTYNLALISQAVSEDVCKYVYSPGAVADNHLGSKYFQNRKFSLNLVICCKFFRH